MAEWCHRPSTAAARLSSFSNRILCCAANDLELAGNFNLEIANLRAGVSFARLPKLRDAHSNRTSSEQALR
jgi:hypothetical protein